MTIGGSRISLTRGAPTPEVGRLPVVWQSLCQKQYDMKENGPAPLNPPKITDSAFDVFQVSRNAFYFVKPQIKNK